MKARVLCLSLVALAFLPLIAAAETYSTDIKAYGDQSASTSIGIMTVDSNEVGWAQFDDHSTTFSGTMDVMKSVPGTTCTGAGCGFDVMQGDYTSGTGHDWGYIDTSTYVDLTNYTGSADMSSYGGIAVCTTLTDAAAGSYNQYQGLSQTVIAPGGLGSSTYNGSQTLDLYTK